jgi:hypothetical protein
MISRELNVRSRSDLTFLPRLTHYTLGTRIIILLLPRDDRLSMTAVFLDAGRLGEAECTAEYAVLDTFLHPTKGVAAADAPSRQWLAQRIPRGHGTQFQARL